MSKLTKRERKVLSNFICYGSYSTLEQYRGKFYWGGEVVATNPVKIGPVYQSLLKKGLIEYLSGHYERHGALYRKTPLVEKYLCQNRSDNRRCNEGKIFVTDPIRYDDGEYVKCEACDGTGLSLEPYTL